MFRAVLAACLLAALPVAGAAQSLFAAVAEVGDGIVTGYELEQRVRLLEATGAVGDVRKTALERLINERIQVAAAERAGIVVTEADIDDGVAEFAGRAGQSSQAFLANLAAEGVSARDFRDFVAAGLAWRFLVRQRFAPQLRVSEAEIDTELGLRGNRASLEFRVAEIFLPTNTPENARLTAELAPQIAALRTEAQFADAARRFSVASTRDAGGNVERWLRLDELPAPIQTALRALRPGQITQPVELQNVTVIFRLRDRRETVSRATASGALDYARVPMAGEGAVAALTAIRDRTYECTDLYGVLTDDQRPALVRETRPVSQVPQALRVVLARLDPGESAILPAATGGGAAELVVLCARLPAGTASDADRERVRVDLQNRKLNAFADGFLQQLRGETRIFVK